MEPAETQPPYGSWATLIWGALALLAPPPIAALCYHYFLQGDPVLSEPMLMLAKIGSVVVVACALRLKGWNIVDYLRLTVPLPREIPLAIAVAIFFWVLQFVTAALTGGWFRTVVLDYVPTSFVLSILVIGPLAEEIVHRGFMYPGLARQRSNPGVLSCCSRSCLRFSMRPGHFRILLQDCCMAGYAGTRAQSPRQFSHMRLSMPVCC